MLQAEGAPPAKEHRQGGAPGHEENEGADRQTKVRLQTTVGPVGFTSRAKTSSEILYLWDL